jgi:hypothetical protein
MNNKHISFAEYQTADPAIRENHSVIIDSSNLDQFIDLTHIDNIGSTFQLSINGKQYGTYWVMENETKVYVFGGLELSKDKPTVFLLDMPFSSKNAEIFKALQAIHNNPQNEDRYGQVGIPNYSKNRLSKVLSAECINYLDSGQCPYGKFELYSGILGNEYYAINPKSKFYQDLKNS